jgi:hypothetical protein
MRIIEEASHGQSDKSFFWSIRHNIKGRNRLTKSKRVHIR